MDYTLELKDKDGNKRVEFIYARTLAQARVAQEKLTSKGETGKLRQSTNEEVAALLRAHSCDWGDDEE